jgi:hypothetical protein
LVKEPVAVNGGHFNFKFSSFFLNSFDKCGLVYIGTGSLDPLKNRGESLEPGLW